MKKLLLAFAATACSPALAADIVDSPPPEPPVAFVPAFSWTGLYVGGQAGGSFNGGSSNAPSSFVFVPGIAATPGTPEIPGIAPTPGTPDQTYAYSFGPTTQNYSADDDSFAGGGHVGYNRAFGAIGGNVFVLGAVADLSFADVSKGGGIRDGANTLGVRQELDYLATVRLKAGLGLDRFLVYGTGGVAFGEVETTFVDTLFLDASTSDTRVGYAVGAGTDYALTDNLLLGVEYLYTDLGSDDTSRVVPLGAGRTLTTTSNEDFDFHTVWAKASFRFN